MEITNLTTNAYVLAEGVTLGPSAVVTVADEAYLKSTTLREQVNDLEADGRVSVASPPAGFPVEGNKPPYGLPPDDRPEVPSSPTAQDVVDALVSLGILKQAS